MREASAPELVPPVLYKYLRRSHAEAMLSQGVVRIGTLEGYRDVERHCPAAGDQHEGLVSAVDYSTEEARQRAGASLSAPSRVGLVVPGDKRLTDLSIYATRDYIQFFEEWPNCYVYCLSEVLDPRVMSAFCADTVVQINEPLRFFRTLTRHLRKRLGIVSYFFGCCGYRDRLISLADEPWLPLLVKGSEYKYQREARMAWLARTERVSPVITRCTALARFCSLVEARALASPRLSTRTPNKGAAPARGQRVRHLKRSRRGG